MLEELVRVVARARSRRYRRAQSFSLRPGISRRARAAPSGEARAGARRQRAARTALAAADRGAHHRVSPLRHLRPQHHRYLDPRAALRYREPRAGKLRAERPGEAFRRSRARGASTWMPRASANISSSVPTNFSPTRSTTCARRAALAEVLSPSYFVQAQIFPYSYQNAVLRGNATKIDALLMRAYIAERHSIPRAVGADRSRSAATPRCADAESRATFCIAT